MTDIRELTKKEFPELLKEIPDPPKKLYLKGILPKSETKLLAVVGSRRMSRYGKDACEHLIRGLRGYPIVIVSGLALGVDGTAHRAALAAELTTIAIPGSGLFERILYPRAHQRLAREIVEKGGALLSEMEPDEPATPYTFPKRNRLMAGIAHATLVIEAGVKSGTLITAKLASEYNRDLLIVPHSIFAEGGAGGHIFMKLGAAPVRSAEDILDILGIKHEKTLENFVLSPDEERVLSMLSSPLPRDELIRTIGNAVGQSNVLLASMELKGLIKESLGEVRRNI